MKVDMLPGALLQMPDPGLFHRSGRGEAGRIGRLQQSDVADHGHVTHLADVGRADGRLSGEPVVGRLEIELVEGHPFDEVSECLGFKRGQRLITQLLIGGPIALIDRVEQVLGVPAMVGTVCFGSPHIGAGLVCSDNGVCVGGSTTGPELNRIEDALGLI